MKAIANDLNGKTGVAYNAEELTGLFLKSIEIIEYREKEPWFVRFIKLSYISITITL